MGLINTIGNIKSPSLLPKKTSDDKESVVFNSLAFFLTQIDVFFLELTQYYWKLKSYRIY